MAISQQKTRTHIINLYLDRDDRCEKFRRGFVWLQAQIKVIRLLNLLSVI